MSLTTTPTAVCPSCASPLLKEIYRDEDLWEAEIAFTDGDTETPRLYHAEWLKGDCWERVTGCAACRAAFPLEDAAVSVQVDEHPVWEEVRAAADDIDDTPYFAQRPTHLASCDCGNEVFYVEMTRSRTFAARYDAGDDDSDPRWRTVVAPPDFEIESIYCPDCDAHLEPDELVATQIATPIHPAQIALSL